jgi:hypothetical protein
MMEQSFDERGQMLEHTLHWEKLHGDFSGKTLIMGWCFCYEGKFHIKPYINVIYYKHKIMDY